MANDALLNLKLTEKIEAGQRLAARLALPGVNSNRDGDRAEIMLPCYYRVLYDSLRMTGGEAGECMKAIEPLMKNNLTLDSRENRAGEGKYQVS